jgi:hypothetical protein
MKAKDNTELDTRYSTSTPNSLEQSFSQPIDTVATEYIQEDEGDIAKKKAQAKLIEACSSFIHWMKVILSALLVIGGTAFFYYLANVTAPLSELKTQVNEMDKKITEHKELTRDDIQKQNEKINELQKQIYSK